MAVIPISKKVLKWARKFRGLSLEDAADKIGISLEKLKEFENGDKFPTLGVFEDIAKRYRLPQATLFRRTPPKGIHLPHDYRTFDGAPPEFGFDFRESHSKVLYLLRNILNLSKDDDEFLMPRPPKYDKSLSPLIQGENERQRIGVSIDDQLNWMKADAFPSWRAIIEKQGINVFIKKFDIQDSRGYSLYDDAAIPAIVINKSEIYDQAKIFTLIHEYVHLLIRKPGISDLNNQNPTESFCNKFAAAFLMPKEALRRVLPEWPSKPIDWDDQVIGNCARRLKVSRPSLALRLIELNLAKQSAYGRARQWTEPRSRRKKSGAGFQPATQLFEIGGCYTSSIINAMDRRVIDSFQASDALGISEKYFDTARESMRRQMKLSGGQ